MKGILKKMLPILLSAIMVLQNTAVVLVFGEALPPEVGTLKIEGDFGGASVPSYIESVEKSTLGLSNGTLKISSGTNAFTRSRINLGETTSGDWVIDMTLRKTSEDVDSVRVYISSALAFMWPEGANAPGIKVGNDNWKYFKEDDYCTKTNFHIVAHYDKTGEVVNVWVNDILLGEYEVSDKSLFAISKVDITTHKANTVCYLEDFKYYIPEASGLSDSERVERDYTNLEDGGILSAPITDLGYLTSNLNLPFIGNEGSTILWESSDESAINPLTGEVIRAEETKSVTLTATVSYGEAEPKTITFGPYIVPESGIVTETLIPETEEFVLEENFDGEKVPSYIVSEDAVHEIENGSLKIKAEKSFTRTIFPVEASVDWVGSVKVRKSDANSDNIRVYMGNALMISSQNGTGKFEVTVDKVKVGAFDNSEFSAESEIHVEAYYNSMREVVAIWLNGKKVGVYDVVGSVNFNLTRIDVTTHKTDTVCYVDYVKVFTPVKVTANDVEMVKKDTEYLENNGIQFAPLTESGYLVDDLNMPSVGRFGSDIVWHVTDSEAIDPLTGYLTCGDEEKVVGVQATISKGNIPAETVDFGTFTIPKKGVSVDSLPIPVSVGLRDDFSERRPNVVTSNGATGRAEVVNGQLEMETFSSDEGQTSAKIYLTESREDISGSFMVEFTVQRDSLQYAGLWWANSNSVRRYTDIRWQSDVLNIYSLKDGVMEKLTLKNEDLGIDYKAKMTIWFDTDNGLMSVYVNNKLVAENLAINRGGISHINFFADNSKWQADFDNFKFSYCQMDDLRTVQYDAQSLNYSKLFADSEIAEGIISQSVSLPQKGERGSVIEWQSSHPEILSPDGTLIKRPDIDTSVNLTAKITSGDVEEYVSFDVTVLRNGDGDLLVLKKDFEAITLESILNEEPVAEGYITENLTFPKYGYFGSKINWSSDNESVITSDGMVIRPADSSGNIYATITASVINGDFTLEKTFTLGVIPLTYSYDNLPVPEVYETVYEAVFKKHVNEIDGDGEYNDRTNIGYEIDDWSSTRGWSGRITEFDGYVEIIRNSNEDARATSLAYNLQPSTENISGLALTKYTLERTDGTGSFTQYIRGSKGVVAILVWGANGAFTIRHKDENGATIETSTKKFKGKLDIAFMSDTVTGRFFMWVNDECVIRDAYPYSIGCSGLKSIDSTIEGNNFATIKLGEFKTYRAYPWSEKRPQYDAEWLTEDIIRDGILAPAKGKLASDLDLLTEAKYGSSITWESSDEELLEADGTIHRPSEGIEQEVTLTATLKYDIFKYKKSFKFNVMPLYPEDEKKAKADFDYLTLENYRMFSFNDNDVNAVTTSLSLPESGPYGSKYFWRSSNKKAITDGGRVIREYWDGKPQTVTMTASIVYGSAILKKDFTFTVLPDEELKDPQHMTDAEFFGVWNDGAWETEGKLNYSYKGLEKVAEAVKDGNNYEKAKVELLEYMRGRTVSHLTKNVKRNPGYAEGFTVTGVHCNRYTTNYQAMTTIRSNEYEEYVIPISASVNRGSQMAFKVGARYNEDTTVRILSSEYEISSMRPRLILTQDGKERVYEAVGDTVIRGGSKRYVNFGDEVEMETRFFGEFQGEGTADVLLVFDLSEISESVDITEAKLVFNAKIEEEFVSEKELLIYKEGNEWTADTVTMDNFMEYCCNYNGIPGENNWYVVKNAESEYLTQHTRFENQRYAATEFLYTGDERYAYAVICDLMDYIIDTQGTFDFDTEIKAGHITYSDWEILKDIERRGVYPGALSIGMKLLSGLTPMFESLLDSKYMTPDTCTAILKNMWDGGYELERYLSDPAVADLGANQKIYEAEAFMYVAMLMPEFNNSEDLIKSSISVMENLIKRSYFEDGAYIESTEGYSTSIINNLVQFWGYIRDYDLDLSEEIRELLGKAAIYNSVIVAPGGIGTAWGDQGQWGPSLTQKNPQYYQITGDEEFQFVNTYGRKGEMPDWTSKLYESSMLAALRSDWSDDALYALMSTSGFLGHGHADANAMSVNAFQRSLLIDGGYFNYDSTSPIRKYMQSTRGHNTVEINNINQDNCLSSITGPFDNIDYLGANVRGEKNNWVSNKEYDFYSVTSTAYKAFKHRRSVTLLKPDFFIVSDLMIPDDLESENNYRQLWHMSAEANLKHDDEKRTIFSNFSSGANVMLANADEDAVIKEEIGYDGTGWGIAAEAKYGYYFKENVKGKQTFDTVIMPYKNDGDVYCERIDLGVPTYDATAMKITSTVDNEVNNTYYMLNYDRKEDESFTFAKYRGNGELNIVRENSDGKVVEVIINNGSEIKNEQGKLILSYSNGTAGDISYEVKDKNIEIYISDDVVVEKIKISSDSAVNTILVNGEPIKFTLEDGVISLADEKAEITDKKDPTSNMGGVSAGGSGGGGSDDKESKDDNKDDKESESDSIGTTTFKDIDNHWAKESITKMAALGVVNGYGEEFAPDRNITRAELIAIAIRTSNLELMKYNNIFEDITADEWYADYIQTALYYGIISEDVVFRPNDNVTREEMCKIIIGAAEIINDKKIEPVDDFVFNDGKEISVWADTFVKKAIAAGLMNGMDNGNFMPRAEATRAQAATVFCRILEK